LHNADAERKTRTRRSGRRPKVVKSSVNKRVNNHGVDKVKNTQGSERCLVPKSWAEIKDEGRAQSSTRKYYGALATWSDQGRYRQNAERGTQGVKSRLSNFVGRLYLDRF